MVELKRVVRRETRAKFFERSKYRNIIVILDPAKGVGLKLKGNRRTFWLEESALYDLAAKKALQQEKREKAKARKAGKKCYGKNS